MENLKHSRSYEFKVENQDLNGIMIKFKNKKTKI